MLTSDGYVDLVAAVHHLPVWQGGATALDANQLSAMPSLHLAWAVWAAVAVWRLSPRLWMRGLAVAYPLVTMFAVMATGNHYLADGAVGAVIAALAVLRADRLLALGRAAIALRARTCSRFPSPSSPGENESSRAARESSGIPPR